MGGVYGGGCFLGEGGREGVFVGFFNSRRSFARLTALRLRRGEYLNSKMLKVKETMTSQYFRVSAKVDISLISGPLKYKPGVAQGFHLWSLNP